MEQMTPYVVDITPQKAQEMLDKTTKENRRLRTPVVDGYVRDMLAGKWRLGTVIAIDTEGNVIDGQHRLNAVIESGTTQQFYIRSGVEPENAIFDTGAPRTLHDVLKLTNPDMSDIYLQGKTITFLRGLLAQDSYTKITLADVVAYIDRYDETLQPFIRRVLSKKTKKARVGAMPTMTALYLAYVNGVCLEEIECFYEVFKSGYGIEERDKPIIATRNWFIDTLMGGGAQVRTAMINRVQYGLNQYLQCKPSSKYYPPKRMIWGYPADNIRENKENVTPLNVMEPIVEKKAG